ncbi:MAG: hypothetical protein OXH47_08585 [Paracoccaceae bacterium]|nr:hypothetical protein [Paracoccaceae bacterium]
MIDNTLYKSRNRIERLFKLIKESDMWQHAMTSGFAITLRP